MVIKKAVYVWVIGILGMISFAACSSASQGEVPSTSNAALDNIFARKSVRAYLDKEPFYMDINLKASKRIGKYLNLAFYVNRLLGILHFRSKC